MGEIIKLLFGRLFRFIFSRRFLNLFILKKEQQTLPNYLRVVSHYLVPVLLIGSLFYFQERKYQSSFTNFFLTQTVYEWSIIIPIWFAIPIIVGLFYFIAKKIEQNQPDQDQIQSKPFEKKTNTEKNHITNEHISSNQQRIIILHEDDYHQFKKGKDGKVPHIIHIEKAPAEEWESYQKQHPYRSYYSPNAVLKITYVEESEWKRALKKMTKKETG
ncbi:hypothetical protein [Thermoflavimicrobium daqui]|uniref:Uncharacterized protein n=1 Tax=Thermoflavimicrobium daqui TaxID=2137476 RepID=A0A364KA04_9BACL|nr:hypothetical protein [Thermoflavimicrobium daqui]RAL27030.1 hypothetical protein DL897_03055 [Thermoflavimicrobium daqui]